MSLIENYEEYLVDRKKQFEDKLRMEPDYSVSIKDFKILRTVGTGSFGTVVLARNINDDDFCAIKVLQKSHIIKIGKVQDVLNEKRLLLSLDFPFIMSMTYFFKDNANVFFVMPFINGGEIFYNLIKYGKFDESLSCFYASQIVLALEYLHYLDIIYRDLKPENVLIDRTGYIRVTDLGLSKIVKTRTYTFCGTPDYIAPEVVRCKGYSHAVDWWALGVFIYEMVSGYPPFFAKDKMKTYELIVAGEYQMVKSFSAGLKDLIKGLLKVNVNERMGTRNPGVRNVKNHEWFRHITWLDIVNKRVKAPLIPPISGPGDTNNFEAYEAPHIAESDVELYTEQFRDF